MESGDRSESDSIRFAGASGALFMPPKRRRRIGSTKSGGHGGVRDPDPESGENPKHISLGLPGRLATRFPLRRRTRQRLRQATLRAKPKAEPKPAATSNPDRQRHRNDGGTEPEGGHAADAMTDRNLPSDPRSKPGRTESDRGATSEPDPKRASTPTNSGDHDRETSSDPRNRRRRRNLRGKRNVAAPVAPIFPGNVPAAFLFFHPNRLSRMAP
jgi:hypothetical protein